MIADKAQEILDFWFKETPSEMHFKIDENLDQQIRVKFLKDYEFASQNEYDDWQDHPMSCLALVILLISLQGIYLEMTKNHLNKITKLD